MLVALSRFSEYVRLVIAVSPEVSVTDIRLRHPPIRLHDNRAATMMALFMVKNFRGLFVGQKIARRLLVGQYGGNGFSDAAAASFHRAFYISADFLPHRLFVAPSGGAGQTVADHSLHHPQGIVVADIVAGMAVEEQFVDKPFAVAIAPFCKGFGKAAPEVCRQFVVA